MPILPRAERKMIVEQFVEEDADLISILHTWAAFESLPETWQERCQILIARVQEHLAELAWIMRERPTHK